MKQDKPIDYARQFFTGSDAGRDYYNTKSALRRVEPEALKAAYSLLNMTTSILLQKDKALGGLIVEELHRRGTHWIHCEYGSTKVRKFK